MKKAMLVLIPFLLLAGCSNGNKDSSSSLVQVPAPGSSSYRRKPNVGTFTISLKNRQGLVVGEGNEVVTNNADFKYDLNKIFNEPQTMDPGLAKLGLLMSAQQYDYFDVETKLANIVESTNKMMDRLYLNNVTTYQIVENEYSIDANDVIQFQIGHAPFEVNGAMTNLVVVSFAGTKTDNEWKSNLDIGSTVQDYMKNENEHPDWTDKANFKGLDVAKNRAKKKIDAYIAEKITNSYPTTYFVSGHSRGGGVANLYARDLIDANKNTVAYTFNSPNTTEQREKMPEYKTIFNFENGEDLLSAIPTENCKFTKFGQKIKLSRQALNAANANFDTAFQSFTNYPYAALTSTNLQTVFKTLNDIMVDRNALYTINAEPYANDSATVNTLADVETKKAAILAAARKYHCEDCIVFEEPVAANNKYKLAWRISNSVVLQIVSTFLSHEIELDATNLAGVMGVLAELQVFAPTLTTKIMNVILILMNDTSKIAIPHTPETFFVGIDHVVK